MAKKSSAKKRTTKKRTAKKAPRKKTAKRTAAKPKSKKPSSNSLESMSLHEIQIQLKARERKLRTLGRRRERLIAQIAELDAEIHALGGRAAAGGKRPRNEKNLGDSLVGVLKGKQMTVTEATQAVQDAGYRTTADSFRTIVNQRLIGDPRFKKVSRGVYTAK